MRLLPRLLNTALPHIRNSSYRAYIRQQAHPLQRLPRIPYASIHEVAQHRLHSFPVPPSPPLLVHPLSKPRPRNSSNTSYQSSSANLCLMLRRYEKTVDSRIPNLRAITGVGKPSALIVSSSSSLLVSSKRRRERRSHPTSCDLDFPICTGAPIDGNSRGSSVRSVALSRRASKIPSSTWCLYKLVSYAVIPTISAPCTRERSLAAKSTPDVPFNEISSSTASKGRSGSAHMRNNAVGNTVAATST